MNVNEIVEHLFRRGCGNLTDSLDQTTFGNFPISYSGISDVYRGRLLAGTQIAVKALRISEGRVIIENHTHLKRAARELYSWSNCKHRNVLQLLGLAIFRGRIAMIFPWTNHSTLPRYLRSAYDVDRCDLCAQICDGLSYLHSVDIVHGDLKGAGRLVFTLHRSNPTGQLGGSVGGSRASSRNRESEQSSRCLRTWDDHAGK
ncbi:kinase-like domain-containing protein [Rhizoctonia solani]|nr:kinase-like domain-containing protein [Rhizoctonia solani]